MEFWRTLFARHHGPTKAFKITPITSAVPYVPIAPLPLPVFRTLVFSSTSFIVGTPSSGTINNALAGSIIVAVGLPAGLTINSAFRTWAWDGLGTAGSGSFTLYENVPGSAGNPNLSTITYTAASGGLSSSATLLLLLLEGA